ncbi:MAG: hypothetical protein AAGA69_01035 [Pseudomonadota bacterium]
MLNILIATAASALALTAQDVEAPVDLEAGVDVETQAISADQPTIELPPSEITKDDIEVIAQAEFEAADVNGDMTVTEEEFLTAALATEAETSLDEELAGGETLEPKADTSAASYLRERFAAISYGDGELTGVELETALKDEFVAADSDGDEKLTGAELETFASIRKGETILR